MCTQLSCNVVNSHLGLSGVPILVVSSDSNAAGQIAILLMRRGGVVRVAECAEEALVVVPRFQPRVLVTDLVLPYMSGFVLVHHLKSSAATADLIVVALTTFDSSLVEAMANEVGCAACIRTPVDPETFAGAVAALVQESQ